MNAATRRHPVLSPVLPRGLLRWWRRSAQLRRRRAEAQALLELGQHELNDLGIGRSELPALMR